MALLRGWTAVAGALAAVLASAGPEAAVSVAAYGPGPRNTWTQAYNTYDGNCAYSGSTPCGDPNCDPSNCQQWPYGSTQEGGYFHGTWYYTGDRSTSFHAAVAQAITDASNEPYYSPSFQEEWSSGWSCSTASLCIEGAHLGTSGSNEQLCATTYLYGIPANAATIDFNLDVSWFVGNPGSGPQNACSINAIAHHEMGHVLGLGHSSDPGALMYWSPTAVNFGADEQAGLKAIYLNNYQPHQAGGGDACNSCQAACETVMNKMPPAAFIIGSGCGAAALPLPTVTYPGLAPQELLQKPLGAAQSEVTTVEAIVHK